MIEQDLLQNVKEFENSADEDFKNVESRRLKIQRIVKIC